MSKLYFIKYYLFIILGVTITAHADTAYTDLNNAKTSNHIMMNGDEKKLKAMKEKLEEISKHKILFAHQSVGQNILDGLLNISKASNTPFDIKSIQTNPPSDKDTFIEFYTGKNQHPKTKVDDFVKKIRSLDPSHTPDIAFMKFCYVDFLQDTDVDDVFDYYKKNIDSLKKERPEITFVHVTTPLMLKSDSTKSKIKRFIKKILGKDDWVDITNVMRDKYNKKLLKVFPHDPIFDLAKIESTKSDGIRSTFTYKGETYFQLSPEYTYDGGHLNDFGKQVVAKNLIEFLYKTINDNTRK